MSDMVPHRHQARVFDLSQSSSGRVYLLRGSDEIHSLQAGERLSALVDVFHN